MSFGGSAYWAGALLAAGAASDGAGALEGAGAALLAGGAALLLGGAATLLEGADTADGAGVTGSARPGSVTADEETAAGALELVSPCIWLRASSTVAGCGPLVTALSRLFSAAFTWPSA